MATNWLCGDRWTDTNYIWDSQNYDFNPCYVDLLYVITTVYIFTCGSWHFATDVRSEKRHFFRLRQVEWILLTLSMVMVVVPIISLVEVLLIENGDVGGHVILSAILRTVGWIWSICVFLMEIRKLLFSPSYTMYGWWVLNMLATAFRFRSVLHYSTATETMLSESMWYLEFALTIGIFSIALFVKRRTDEEESQSLKSIDSSRYVAANGYGHLQEKSQRLVDPIAEEEPEEDDIEKDLKTNSMENRKSLEATASLFSIMIFAWISPIFSVGNKRQLKFGDFQELMHFDEAREISTTWDEEFAKETSGGELSSFGIVRLLLKGFGKPFWIGGILKLFSDGVLFINPQLLSSIIGFVTFPDREEDWRGYFYAVMMFVSAMGSTLLLGQYFHRVFRVGMHLKAALIGAVYKKALLLSNSARGDKTVGEIVNLMSTDSQRLASTIQFLHMIWSAPVQLALGTFFLWQEVGPSVFLGLAVMFVFLIPVNAMLIRKIRDLQRQLMKIKDNRLKITNEVLASMKAIKLYGWENKFNERIIGVRDQELATLRKYVFVRTWLILMFTSTPVLVTLVTFGAYTLLGNELTAATAFTSLALFNVIRFPIIALPSVVNSIIESTVSIDRLVSYFNAEEIERPLEKWQLDFMKQGESIVMEEGTYYWDDRKEKIAVNNVSLVVREGELCMVVGKTGCGKSALLRAIIGDLVREHGRCGLAGTIAYAAQVPWIQNATLRDNILFGRPYDRKFYKKVVHACALQADIDILTAGDQTEIGEKGINLSGGQKQRVALARAVYADADIYLLDDTLSAVDAHVGRHIMRYCITDLLKDKARLFVTNSVHFLEEADNVVVLEDAKLTHEGTYDELMSGDYGLENILTAGSMEEQKQDDDIDGAPAEPGTPIKQPSLKKQKSDASDLDENEELIKIGGQLIKIEKRARGRVSTKVYWAYLSAAGGIAVCLGIFCTMTLRTAGDVGTQRWLAYWSDEVDESRDDDTAELDTGLYLGIYAALSIATIGFILSSLIILIYAQLRAAKILHVRLLDCVLRAPMTFFDTTPVGRILNRFSQDTYQADINIPPVMLNCLTNIFKVGATVGVIVAITPYFGIAVLPLAVIYYWNLTYYISASRDIKRWSSVLHSPIYAHFSETLDGTSTIRAFSANERFSYANEEKIDNYFMAYYAGLAGNRWLAVRLEFVGTVIVGLSSIFAVTQRSTISGGLAGMSISYALQITGTLNFLVRSLAEMENQVVAVERIEEFSTLESEAPLKMDDFDGPGDGWPQHGKILLDNLKLRYRPELPLVLMGVNAEIKPNEKVGIVGRTGAGKTSLFTALMRLVEPAGGVAKIDGIDITTVGLHDLRKNIAIIPQDPELFSGTIRFNLDPFTEFSDDDIWETLKLAHLDGHVRSLKYSPPSAKGKKSGGGRVGAGFGHGHGGGHAHGGGGGAPKSKSGGGLFSRFKRKKANDESKDALLKKEEEEKNALPPEGWTQLEYEVSEGGKNFSVGQRQLLSIARALLRRTKIILLDEATSAVDVDTDRLVQQTIREAFAECTVLTIAHRLGTIMDSDRILVMDNGRVSEFDTPQNLLADAKSLFSGIYEAAFGGGTKEKDV